MNDRSSNFHVSYLGIDRVNLGGNDIDQFLSMPNSELIERKIKIKGLMKIIRTVIVKFEDEKSLLEFLQRLIDQGVCFTDNYQSQAYMEACSLKDQGYLTGKIIGC